MKLCFLSYLKSDKQSYWNKQKKSLDFHPTDANSETYHTCFHLIDLNSEVWSHNIDWLEYTVHHYIDTYSLHSLWKKSSVLCFRILKIWIILNIILNVCTVISFCFIITFCNYFNYLCLFIFGVVVVIAFSITFSSFLLLLWKFFIFDYTDQWLLKYTTIIFIFSISAVIYTITNRI